jgi:S-adenosylmethionine decarboxylase
MQEKYDHFIQTHNIIFTGLHILADLKGIDVDNNTVVATFEKALEDVNATILEKSINYFLENNGITGCYILAESHLTFHSWWEAGGTLIMDLYTCGTTNPLNALRAIKTGIAPKRAHFRVIPRGPIYEWKSDAFYVYTLSDPRTNQIFYVGKGKKQRLSETVKQNSHQPEKSKIISELSEMGLKPKLNTVTEKTTEPLAFLIETYLIDFYGLGVEGGLLVNKTKLDKPCNSEKISDTLKNYYKNLSEEQKIVRSRNISAGILKVDQELRKKRYAERSKDENYIKNLKKASSKRDISFMKTPEWGEKMRQNRLKKYKVTFDDGSVKIVNNLKFFCTQNGYVLSTLKDRIKGNKFPYKGMISVSPIEKPSK